MLSFLDILCSMSITIAQNNSNLSDMLILSTPALRVQDVSPVNSNETDTRQFTNCHCYDIL